MLLRTLFLPLRRLRLLLASALEGSPRRRVLRAVAGLTLTIALVGFTSLYVAQAATPY